MGGGKGSSSTTVQLTPEQREVLAIQRDALRDVFLPAYQQTVGGAGNVLASTYAPTTQTAQTAMDVAQQAGALQQGVGSASYLGGTAGTAGLAGYQQGLGQGLTGMGATGLASLFSPQYKEEQIYASLQPTREALREQMGEQNAQFGAAGALGSARQGLARENLRQLGEQRLYSAAAQTSAAVEQQRQAAAQALLGAGQAASGQAGQLYGGLAASGQQGLTGAQQAAASRIGFAGAPQDLYSRYASVVYGVPQQSTTPNFAGTQGQSQSSKGFGFNFR